MEEGALKQGLRILNHAVDGPDALSEEDLANLEAFAEKHDRVRSFAKHHWSKKTPLDKILVPVVRDTVAVWNEQQKPLGAGMSSARAEEYSRQAAQKEFEQKAEGEEKSAEKIKQLGTATDDKKEQGVPRPASTLLERSPLLEGADGSIINDRPQKTVSSLADQSVLSTASGSVDSSSSAASDEKPPSSPLRSSAPGEEEGSFTAAELAKLSAHQLHRWPHRVANLALKSPWEAVWDEEGWPEMVPVEGAALGEKTNPLFDDVNEDVA